MGCFGEELVSKKLSSLDNSVYHVFNNVILNNREGGTCQIDHIIVSIYGIFVIETKGLSGSVVGSIRSNKWKRLNTSSGRLRNSCYIYNPVKQNKRHVDILMNVLGLDRLKFTSIVCFTNDKCCVKVKEFKSIYADNLLSEIKGRNVEKLSYKEVKHICGIINKLNIKKKNRETKHIEYCKSRRG